MPSERDSDAAVQENATRLINSCNATLRSLYREARTTHTDAILTGLVIHSTSPEVQTKYGFAPGVNLFVQVIPRPIAIRLLRSIWKDKAEIERVTSKSANGIFEVYVITKDALNVFRKPVAEFVA